MGWLAGWQYRKKHVVNGAVGAGTGYQVKLVVHYGFGADSSEHVYLYQKCRSDFGDVRVTLSDGETVVAGEGSGWRESKVDSDQALIWVKVPDSLESNVTIYIYYGHADAVWADSGSETFWLFDDFEDGLVVGFFKNPNNPLFAAHSVQPSVIRVGSEYWLYYDDGVNVYRRVGTNETTFGQAQSTGIAGIYCHVWKDGDVYRMVYSSTDLSQVRLATSSDGLNFVYQGVLASKGASGWDSGGIFDPCEIKVDGVYYLYFGGSSVLGDATKYKIGAATSPTGQAGSYTKHPNNPILDKSASGWDCLGVTDPHAVEYDSGKFMLFFTGFDEPEEGVDKWKQCGYATSTDLINWTKSTDNPIYYRSQTWESASGLCEPSVLVEDGKFKVWYRGKTGADSRLGYLYFDQDLTTKLPVAKNLWTIYRKNDASDEIAEIATDNGKKVLRIAALSVENHEAKAVARKTPFNNFVMQAKIRYVNWRNIWEMARTSRRYVIIANPNGYFFVHYASIPNGHNINKYNGGWASDGNYVAYDLDETKYYKVLFTLFGNVQKGEIFDGETVVASKTVSFADFSSGYSGFSVYCGAYQPSEICVDYVFVRKYVDPEPAHGAWYRRESNPTPSLLQTFFGRILRRVGEVVEILEPVTVSTDDYGNQVTDYTSSCNTYSVLKIVAENERFLAPGTTEKAEATAFFEPSVEVSAGDRVKTAHNGDWQVLYVKKLVAKGSVHHIEALMKRLEAQQ